jgi:uncharacterized protein (TIGR03086 family)
MTADPVSQLSTALGVTGQLISAVRNEQWAAPTPCPDWRVRDLVSHVVAGNTLFASALRGQPPAPGGLVPADPGQPADVLAAAYWDSADNLLEAFHQPGALERSVTVPFNTVPGIAALHLRITELLVHGWDLARATGQRPAFPDDLAAQELAFTRSKLADIPPGRSPFGPPQPVADDAAAIDRLAACLGRDVTAPKLAAALGSNVHIFAQPQRRGELEWCFGTVLGCPVTAASRPGIADPMLIVRFPAGGNLSIEFTDHAPDSDQPRLGAWLELRAADPAALMERAVNAGLKEIKHPGHPYYFMVPGGQVFTIAPTG